MEKKEVRRQQPKGIFWANLLNFYQPPDQDKSILAKVVSEAYDPLIAIFEKLSSAHASVNIPGCTIELLIRSGHGQIITRLRNLVKKGQLELVATARFHPILPLVPDEEVDRQVVGQDRIARQYFGVHYMPRGFYSPELAYDTIVAKAAVRRGCRWLAVDEIAIAGSLGQLSYDRLYMDKTAGGLILVPQQRRVAEALAGSIFATDEVKSAADFMRLVESPNRRYLLTVCDADQFGHHQPNGHALLKAILEEQKLTAVTVSELVASLRKKEYCTPKASDRTSTPEEVKNRQVFSTWNHPANKVQRALWELYRLVYDEIKTAAQNGDAMHNRAREILGAAASSCNFLWASCRPWWHSVFPENAATSMCAALFCLLSSTMKIKDRAFKARETVLDLVREYNESGEARKQQLNFLKSRKIDARRFFEKPVG